MIVNGGLSALLVFELARECLRKPPAKMSVRNMRRMFGNRPLTVCGKPLDKSRAIFWVADCDGALALSADLELVT